MIYHYHNRKVGTSTSTSSSSRFWMMMMLSILLLLTVIVSLPVVSGSDTVSVSHQQLIHSTNHNTTGTRSNHTSNKNNNTNNDNDTRSSIVNIPLIHFRIVLDKDISETVLQTTLVQYLTNAMMIDNTNTQPNKDENNTTTNTRTNGSTTKLDTNFISLIGIPALLTYYDFTYQGSLTIHQNAKNTYNTTTENTTDFRFYHHRLEQQQQQDQQQDQQQHHQKQQIHQNQNQQLNDWTMKQVLALQDDISLKHILNVAMMSSMSTIDGNNEINTDSIDRHNTVIEYFQTIQIQFLQSIFPLVEYTNDEINDNSNKNNRTDTDNNNNNNLNDTNNTSITDTVSTTSNTKDASSSSSSSARSTNEKIILILTIAGSIFAVAILIQCYSIGMSIVRNRRNKLLQQQLHMFDSTSTNSRNDDNDVNDNGSSNQQQNPNVTNNRLVEDEYIIPSTKQYRNRSFWSKILPNRRQYDIVRVTSTSSSPTSGSANSTTPKSFTSPFFTTNQSKTKSKVIKTPRTTAIPYGITKSPRNLNDDHDNSNSSNDGEYEDELVSIDQQQQQQQQYFDRIINDNDIEKNQCIDNNISINKIADNEMNTNNNTTTGGSTTLAFPANTIRSDSPILRSTVLQMMLMVAETTNDILVDTSSNNNNNKTTTSNTNKILLLSTPTTKEQQLNTKYDLATESNTPIRPNMTSSLGTIPEIISFITTSQKNSNDTTNHTSPISTTSTSKNRCKQYNEIKDELEEYQRSLTDPINDTTSTTSYTSSMSSMYRTTNNHITTRYRNTCQNTSSSTAGGGGSNSNSNSNSNHTRCSIVTNSPPRVNCSNRTMSSISMNMQEDAVSVEDNLLQINDESKNININNYISSPIITSSTTTTTRSNTSLKLDDTNNEILGIDPIIGISTHTVFSNKNCDNTISSIEMEDEGEEEENNSNSSFEIKDVTTTGTSRKCSQEKVHDADVCLDDKKHSNFNQGEEVSRDNDVIVDGIVEQAKMLNDQFIQSNTDSITSTMSTQKEPCTVDTTAFVKSDNDTLDHDTNITKESEKSMEPCIDSTEAALSILSTIEKTLHDISYNFNNDIQRSKHNEVNDAVLLTESTPIVPTPDKIIQLIPLAVSEHNTLVDNSVSTAVDEVNIDGTDSLLVRDSCTGNINDNNVEEQQVDKSSIDIPVLGIQKMIISSFRGPQNLYTQSDVSVSNSIIYEKIQNSIIDDESNTVQLHEHFSKYQPSSACTVSNMEDIHPPISDEQYLLLQPMIIPYEAHLLPVEEVSDEEKDMSIDDILYSPSLTSDESNATGSTSTDNVVGTELSAVNYVQENNDCNTTKEEFEFQTERSVTTGTTTTAQSNVSGPVDDTSLASSSSSNDYHQNGSDVVQVLRSTSSKWQHINHESFQDSKTLSVDIEFIPSCSEHSTSVHDGSDIGRVVVDTIVPRTDVVNEIQPSENEVVEFVIDHSAHSQEIDVMIQDHISNLQIQTILDTKTITSEGIVEFIPQFCSNHTTSASTNTKIRDDSTGDSSETFIDIIACDDGTVKNESMDQSMYSNEAVYNTSPPRSFEYQKQRKPSTDYSHHDSDTVIAVKDDEEAYNGSGCDAKVLDGEKQVIVSNTENQVNSPQVNSIEARKRINEILKPLLAKYSIGTIIERVHNDKDGSTSCSSHHRSHSYDEHLYGQYSTLENKETETWGHKDW